MRTTEPRGEQAYPCRGDAATGLAKETAADEPFRACVMSCCRKPVEEVGGSPVSALMYSARTF